jgi:hypothetical protein
VVGGAAQLYVMALNSSFGRYVIAFPQVKEL